MSAFPNRWRRFAAPSLAVILALVVVPPSLARAEVTTQPARTLDDGTQVEEFRLSNGLRVVTRRIPDAGAVAVTLAYGFGAEHDPPGREGLVQLVSRAWTLAAAGDVPERTEAELESARPLGWALEVTRRVTRLTEMAAKPQFFGVLHQMAQRAKSVSVSPKVYAAALEHTKGLLARNYRDEPGVALYYQVREVAGPGQYARALRYASGEGLASASATEVGKLAREWFVPANAVLSLSGAIDLASADLARLLENEFGGVPAGAPFAAAPRPALNDTFVVVHRPGLEYAIGSVAIIAPALDDTLHPSFYLHSLLIGQSFAARWPRNAVTPSRFQYSLFDDPDLARTYPVVSISDYEIGRIREEYLKAMTELTRSSIRPGEYRALHSGVRWLIGGPLTPELLRRIPEDRGILLALNTAAATRELWGGQRFWSEYLRRFDALDRPRLADWADWYGTPDHQVQLLYDPISDRFSTK